MREYGQDNKYKEAIRYYEPIVKKHSENVLNVTAMVLANLCVSYIMTSQVRRCKLRETVKSIFMRILSR